MWIQNNVQEKNREVVGLVFNETWAFRTVPSIPLLAYLLIQQCAQDFISEMTLHSSYFI